jgi:ribosomal protein S18 acetylase RimI-like enzyme
MIREADIKDISRMAEIHVFGWRCAYKDFIPMNFLINEMTVKHREEKFREYLSEENDNNKTYVFEEKNMIKGFMTTGNCRDEDKNDSTYELWAIYIDPLFQRQNIGTQFVNYCKKEAINKGKNEITLWVFEKNNKAIEFYKKKGFEFDGKKQIIKYFDENNYFKENEIRLIYNIKQGATAS